MEVSELRVGNWVKYGDYFYKVKYIRYIESYQKYALIFDNLYHGVYIDDVEPIKLSKKVMDMCVFEQFKQYYSYDIGEFDSYLKGYDENMHLSLSIFGHAICKDIEYLHDLQNFYFAINDKELEVIYEQ